MNNSENRQSLGPYDLAMYIAKSFGKSLPFVVIVALIGYGAWYAIREMGHLQSQLINLEQQKSKAEIEKAQAEADAEAAADRARYEALKEYAEQLNKLNSVSVDVSKRIQDLVSSQVDNIKKNEELSKIQADKTRNYQKELVEAAENKLDDLNTKIKEANRRADEQSRVAALTEYNNIKKNISLQMADGRRIDRGILDLFVQNLDNPQSKEQAINDLTSERNSWQMRTIIACILYRKTSVTDYIKQAFEIIKANSKMADSTIISLLSGYDNFSYQQRQSVLIMLIDSILDEKFDEGFRSMLFAEINFYESDKLAEKIVKDKYEELIRYGGNLLIETSAAKTSDCYVIQDILENLAVLSKEEKRAYALKALNNSGGRESDRQCIKEKLEKAINEEDLEGL